jgi:hypothetical protein
MMQYGGYGQQIDDDQQKMGMFRGLGRRMPPMGLGPQQPQSQQKQPLMAAPLDLSVNQAAPVQLQPWEATKEKWGFGGETKPSIGGAGATPPIISMGADGLPNPGLSGLMEGGTDAAVKAAGGGGIGGKIKGFFGA